MALTGTYWHVLARGGGAKNEMEENDEKKKKNEKKRLDKEALCERLKMYLDPRMGLKMINFK